ncbi:MAG: hypothetical protein NW206_08170 [Hyphomonadaceae bacterium]|nr:hypothetical protein [Hyphomonadaceae bacterium]
MTVEFFISQGHAYLSGRVGPAMPYNLIGDSRLKLTFSPAPNGASTANPPPGECAWLDRPVAGGGRFEMFMQLRVPDSYVLRTARFVGDGCGNFRFDGLNTDNNASDATFAQVRTIIDALEAEDLFTVYAYGAGDTLYITAVSLDDAGPN